MKREVQSRYDIEIGELQDSIHGQKQRLFELKQMRAEETCKFQIGDEVVNPRGGQIGKVASIRDGWDEAIATIRLYKKDGTLGLRTAKTYSWEGWKLK